MNRKLAVKIARDVLAQLRLKKFIASQGSYCSVFKLSNNDSDEIFTSDIYFQYPVSSSFQEAFQENKDLKCTVCALGSVFASWINIRNEASINEVNGIRGNDIVEQMGHIFNKQDLLLMEFVFEEGQAGLLNNLIRKGEQVKFSPEELDKAKKYGLRYTDDNERLRVIMLNVIRNNGRFILPKKKLRHENKLTQLLWE